MSARQGATLPKATGQATPVRFYDGGGAPVLGVPTQGEPMAPPESAPVPHADHTSEHAATVCIPCPRCGEVIRSFKVAQKGRRETATVTATCPNAECKWQDEADQSVGDLTATSLAPPLPVPTAYAPTPEPLDLDAPIFPSAPGAAHVDAAGDVHIDEDAEIDADELEDTGLFAAAPSALDDDFMASSRPSFEYPQSSNGGTRTLRRSRGEAWALTVVCLIALGAGALELIFLSYRLSAWKIILVSVVLLPIVALFLINGLRDVWRTTQT